MVNDQRILRIDLTTGNVVREAIPDTLRRKYLGGEGINALLLWQHFLKTPIDVDPCCPDNVLIVGSGPLSGTFFGAGSKTKFTFKSPAYNICGDSTSGGGLGTQLRWSGYDHVVITGKADRPSYLWIYDDAVEVRDARHLSGLGAEETDQALKNELGSDRVDTACIGPAGENLVRFASIMVSGHRAAGRGGGGCVMGSKNLKAIASLGTKGLIPHDAKALFSVTDEFLATSRGFRDAKGNGVRDAWMRWGTLRLTRGLHKTGFNIYRNDQGRELPDDRVEKLDHLWYTSNLGVRSTACSPGCAFACNHWHRIKGDETPAAVEFAGERGSRPEKGSAVPLAEACDVPDMPAVAHLNSLCNRLGLDTMEMGLELSLLMELFERQIVDRDDLAEWTDGQVESLEWGDYRSMEKAIGITARREGRLGELLGGGVFRAAQRIGAIKSVDVLKYAIYGKAGAADPATNSRGWPAMGFGSAVSCIGGHHMKGHGITTAATSTMYFGTPDAAEMTTVALKGAGQAMSERLMTIPNSIGVCWFLLRETDVISLSLLGRAYEAMTGLRISEEEMLVAGDRIGNLQKAFNSRLGLRREHDTVCDRWLHEPRLEGVSKGMKMSDYLEDLKDQYYDFHGWDRTTSLQTRQKLLELDMGDIASVLEREGALVG